MATRKVAAQAQTKQPIQELAQEVSQVNKQLDQLMTALEMQARRVKYEDEAPMEVEMSVKSIRDLQSLVEGQRKSDVENLMTEMFDALSMVEAKTSQLKDQLQPVLAEAPETAEKTLGAPSSLAFRGARLTYGLHEMICRLNNLTCEIDRARSNLVI